MRHAQRESQTTRRSETRHNGDKTMTSTQTQAAKNIRNEWMQDHRGYDECRVEMVGPALKGGLVYVFCSASIIDNGQRYGEKSAVYKVGPRGGVR
jgi:hypothetical protein